MPGGRIKLTSSTGDSAGDMLEEDGTFHIENAPIGDVKVTVDSEYIRPELGSRYVKLPAKYMKPDTTDLTFKVEAGSNKAEFKLQ